ncbi:alpha/beta fold hydrolase [Agrobacterium vitis]|uniref:Alpha/beta fold hydrolase n=1 Tax=Agrobacterium vitis TaxID=373 RepID=A0A6L6VEN5_AGRVI|nr:alpha/beta hydrolase [Agrobacterium vitis]MUZ73268.1 alpha/beta fold hydrolase [Agrobacterium vitis]
MFDETLYLQKPDGARIAYHHHQAENDEKAILLVNHGLIEHSRRYSRFAAFMAASGFHVYAHDHRGHGETQAPDAPLGRFARKNGVSLVIEDAKAIRDLASANHPGLPVLLFGHSMGGLIALRTATEFPESFQALAVWNSNFNNGIETRFARLVLKIERALKGSDVPSLLMAKATFEAWGKSVSGRRTLLDWLSRDDAEVDLYANDPLCRFQASNSLWMDVLDLTAQTATLPRLARLRTDLPIHLVGGGQDPATKGGEATRALDHRLRQSGLTDVTLTLYPAMRHETLNEIGRDKAMAAFRDWARTALGLEAVHSGLE